MLKDKEDLGRENQALSKQLEELKQGGQLSASLLHYGCGIIWFLNPLVFLVDDCSKEIWSGYFW